MADKRWPLRVLIARFVHQRVNQLAWRFASPTGPTSMDRIDRTRLLWRLNDWLADQWVPWWIRHG